MLYVPEVKTGEVCDVTGDYVLTGYTDGTFGPECTVGETVIRMEAGKTVPPVRSVCKGAFRRLVRHPGKA